MSASNDHDRFVNGIREAVREALAKTEEANRQQAVEQLLKDSENTAKTLKSAIESKEVELAAAVDAQEVLRTKVEELEARAAELLQKLEDSDKLAKELKEKASVAEGELENIAADRRQEVRMADLEAAKVASANDEKRKAQASRVRGMSDEEYASYKQELVDLRASLEMELQNTNTERASEETVEEETEEVAPADLTKARKEQAAQAAAATLNIEVASEDLKAKYARFGMAMAKNLGSRE